MGQALITKKNKSNRAREYEPKEEYFIKNGSILLEKRITLTQTSTGPGQVKIFSANEIENAINLCQPETNFSRIICMLYKATLDGRVCGICVSQQQQLVPNSALINRILTDIATRMVLHHDNILKLYGCCLETCIPIPVYEFWPNRNLYEHLHGDTAVTKHLNWVHRLRIATYASYALSYMHNALSKRVVHRALQSRVILLDDTFHVKLGNFAYSVVIKPGETSRRWPVEGVPGYIDPEYIETQVVTDMCDVYSFGVLMLELLSGRNPGAMAQRGRNLVDEFASAMEQNCMVTLIDKEVMAQASSAKLEQVARLALKCVARKGEDRPTMIEVVRKLWEVQGKYN